MPSRTVAQTDAEFFAWFESLSLEAQRDVLRVANRIQQESFAVSASVDLIKNPLLEILSSICSPIFLN